MINEPKDLANEVYVAGVRVDLHDRSTVLQIIEQSITDQEALCSVHTLNPEILMQAYRSQEYACILNKGSINTVDGVGLEKALKIRNNVGVDRICGSDLIYDLASIAEKSCRPIMLVGGERGRLEKAKKALQKNYTNLDVVALSPTFTNRLPLKEQQQIQDLIQATQPSVVVVCLGAPRQEMWIAQNKELLQSNNVNVAAGLGGTVDFLSGEITRAPKWVQRVGLEWAYRLLQQPSRLKRQLSTLPEFAFRSIFNPKFIMIEQQSNKKV